MSPPDDAVDDVVIRPIERRDAQACGRIHFEAFRAIDAQHGFAPELAAPESAMAYVAMRLAGKGTVGFVAERRGKIAGFRLIDERSPAVAGLGPLAVDPAEQDHRVGQRLFDRTFQHLRERGTPRARLVQSGYHLRSLALFTRLGFDVREPLVMMRPTGAAAAAPPGFTVRPAAERDLEPCNALCAEIHGFDRGGELADGIRYRTAVVVEQEGALCGYASAVGIAGHAVARTREALQALVASARKLVGDGILVPTRDAELFRWFLAQRFKAVKPMNLMTWGPYQEPKGASLPSNLF